MPSYDALKNKQTELIRKALDGSVFLAPIGASPITALTQSTGSAVAATLVGTGNAVNIATGGNLVLSINNGAPITVALATSDAPSAVVTKVNTAIGALGTASLASSKFQIVSALTGANAKVKVVSGTGTVLANLFLTAAQEANGSNAGVNLLSLPSGWDDLGWLSNDGAAFSRDVSSSDVTSWGSVTPTRTDITADTTTLTVVAHETKLLTIGMATGADLTGITPDGTTGEVKIAKPSRPKSAHYRALSLAVDQGDAGEIYVARFLPRAKVSSYSEQSFGGGDDPISWGVTMTGEEDSDLGYSEAWFFGGAGWLAILADMGF